MRDGIPTDPQQDIDFNNWTAPRIGEKPAVGKPAEGAEQTPDSQTVESPAKQLVSEIQSQWADASEDQRHEWHNQMLGLTGDSELSFEQFKADMDARPPVESKAAPLDAAPVSDVTGTGADVLSAIDEAPTQPPREKDAPATLNGNVEPRSDVVAPSETPTQEAGEPKVAPSAKKQKHDRRPINPEARAAAGAKYAELLGQLSAAQISKRQELEQQPKYQSLQPNKKEWEVRQALLKDATIGPLIEELDKVKELLASPVKKERVKRDAAPRSVPPTKTIESGAHLEFDEASEASDATRADLREGVKAAETKPAVPPENLPITPVAPTEKSKPESETTESPAAARIRELLEKGTPKEVAERISQLEKMGEGTYGVSPEYTKLKDRQKAMLEKVATKGKDAPSGEAGEEGEPPEASAEDMAALEKIHAEMKAVEGRGVWSAETMAAYHELKLREAELYKIIAAKKKKPAAEAGPDSTPEDAEEEPDVPVTDLGVARKKYATALRQRAWILGGTSEKKLNAASQEYQKQLQTETTEQLQKVKEKFADRDLKDPVVQAELIAEISGVLIDLRQVEEGQLRYEMKNEQEKSVGNNIRKWWTSNSKARFWTGVGLMGAGIATAGLGQFWLTGTIASLRAVATGTGTAMTAERGIKYGRERFGDTKKLSKEQIDAMELPDLERLLAAHTMSYVDSDFGRQFGEHKRMSVAKGKLKRESDTTGRMIEEAYRQKMEAKLRTEIKGQIEGKSLEDAVAAMADKSLDGELQKAYRSARDKDRGFNRRKWAVAVGLGTAAGVLTYLLGTQAKSGEPGQSTPDTAASKTGAEADLAKVAAPDSAAVDTTRAATKAGSWLKASQEHAGVMGPQPLETVVEAHKGDTVWGIIKHQLHERMGDDKWTQLGEAGQTNAVANVLEHVKDNPTGFGLTHGVDHLNVGDKVDLTQLFQGEKAVNVVQMFEHSQHLTSNADIAKFIVDNNHTIAQWHLEHPNQFMSTEVIQKILDGHHEVVKGAVKAGQGIAHTATEAATAPAAAASEATVHMAPDGTLVEAGTQSGVAADSAANVHVGETAGQAVGTATEQALKLPPDAVKAFGEYRDLHDTWTMNWSEAAEKQFDQSLDKLMMHDIVKRGTIETFLTTNNPQAEHHTLVELSKKMWNLIRELPKDAYKADDSLGDVLRTVDDSVK